MNANARYDLEFAARYGDGALLLARLRDKAMLRGYTVELEEPDRPLAYDSRVILKHDATVPDLPQLFAHDPEYGHRFSEVMDFFTKT